MSKVLLAAGVAALAIASPSFADKGGHGGGHGNGGGAAMSAHGNGGGGGQAMHVDRGHGAGHAPQPMHAERHGGGAMRHADNGAMHAAKSHGPDRGARPMIAARGNGPDKIRDNDVRVVDSAHILARNFDGGFGGYRPGCPPGLDKKDNGCLPPGQASKFLGARLQSNIANSLLPFEYRDWYHDDGDHFYRSGDGYIYRVNRSTDLIDGLIPLFGGGGYYALGDRWPQPYDFYNVPLQYRDYYADGGDYAYRYGDGAIYRLNSGSGAVDAIVALLAGDLGVGQRLPIGYDTYNVPFQYRDRYYDSADSWYRYNDGYIYQVDPKTRLISAVINALV